MHIALVTSERMPRAHWYDGDSGLLAAELKRAGITTSMLAWDSNNPVDWSVYDTLVLQSPWSMWQKRRQFDRWLVDCEERGQRLLNPPDIVRIGSDKRYLSKLSAAGVATVPTTILEVEHLPQQIEQAFPAQASVRGTVVVKPLSSGGAMGTCEFGRDRIDDAVAHAQRLIAAGSGALVQPYIEAIDEHRELGVLTLAGEISHAITKRAIITPGNEERAFHPDPRPHILTARQRDTASKAYEAFLAQRKPNAPPPFSVRMDFIIDPESDPGLLLLEVEAVAPVRFFGLHMSRVPAFARTIATYASS
ncbi:hypothetical protein AB0C12_42965 [Actinoplanes sp. NPDC048967]|uniref:ATP-grasp domain-containing protein n=1 Tax=Actinoplanes sp. NPDC048967 TaxID=3155269 RepID=UPI0033FD0968